MQIKKAVKEHTHIKKETIINNSHATRVPRDLADLTAVPAFDDDNP